MMVDSSTAPGSVVDMSNGLSGSQLDGAHQHDGGLVGADGSDGAWLWFRRLIVAVAEPFTFLLGIARTSITVDSTAEMVPMAPSRSSSFARWKAGVKRSSWSTIATWGASSNKMYVCRRPYLNRCNVRPSHCTARGPQPPSGTQMIVSLMSGMPWGTVNAILANTSRLSPTQRPNSCDYCCHDSHLLAVRAGSRAHELRTQQRLKPPPKVSSKASKLTPHLLTVRAGGREHALPLRRVHRHRLVHQHMLAAHQRRCAGFRWV